MACVLCNRKCVDIQTRAFRNQLAKECDTWTNARSIVRTNFVRQKFRERLCRSSNLFFKPLHTLNTLLGWSKVYDSFHVQLANFWKHQQPTSLCTVLLDVAWTWSVVTLASLRDLQIKQSWSEGAFSIIYVEISVYELRTCEEDQN